MSVPREVDTMRECEAAWRRDVAARLREWPKILSREERTTAKAALREREAEATSLVEELRQDLQEIEGDPEQLAFRQGVIMALEVPTLLDHRRHAQRLRRLLTPPKPGTDSRISDAALEAARAYPLERLIEEEGISLRQVGTRWVGLCPFHEDSTPSFTVYPDGRFHCFGCQASGDGIEFLQRHRGLSFRDAVARLAGGVS